MGITAMWNNLPSAARTGIVGGAAVVGIGGAATGITLAVTRPRTADDFVRGQFDDFDRDDSLGISEGERTRRFSSTSTSSSDSRISDDYVSRTTTTRRTTWTESVSAAAAAADKLGDADGTASFQELAKLAASFDDNGDGKVGFMERNRFKDQYGVQTSNRSSEILDRSTRVVYSPKPEPAPVIDNRPTSGGDSGGSTSTGDSGYSRPAPSRPSSGGTSSGDSGGYSGGSGSSSSGNSTDNGNAEW